MCQASSRETSGGASSIRWDGGVSNSNRTRTDGWTDRQHPLVLSRLKLVPSRLVSRPWLLALMIIVLLVAIVTHSHSPPRELRSNLCRIQNIILDSMYHAQWQWEVVSLHTDICWATSLRFGGGDSGGGGNYFHCRVIYLRVQWTSIKVAIDDEGQWMRCGYVTADWAVL